MKKTAKSAIIWVAILVATFILSKFIPSAEEGLGIFSIIPSVFLIIYIFATKRILESLTLAILMGIILAGNGNILESFTDLILVTLAGDDIPWIFLVGGLMGVIIKLIEYTGGAMAFAKWVSSKAKSRVAVLFCTWLVGMVCFVDDYLSGLVVGSAMKPITDEKKVSREYLSFLVDSTASPSCIFIPMSTWGVFIAKLLESCDWAPEGEGLAYYIKTIPLNFYAWLAVLIPLLMIFGKFPLFGPLKRAEERVAKGGPLAPEGSENTELKSESPHLHNGKMIDFILPMVVLMGATLAFGTEMALGTIFTVGFMFVFYLLKGSMNAKEFSEQFIVGLSTMIMPLMLMLLAFVFKDINDQIGFTQFVIETAVKYMPGTLVPVMVFIVLSLTEFISGTNWGMYAIALPIVIPMAMAMNLNMPLCVAAVLAAGVFGSHISMCSDCTVLASAACGCDNYEHGRTQMYYGFIEVGVSAVIFAICGFVM